MNRSSLVRMVAEELDLPPKQVHAVLEAFLRTIQRTVVSGERVTLTGFGSFVRSWHPPRSGRNPATGRFMWLNPSHRASFRPGAGLRRDLMALIPRFDSDPEHQKARRVARTLVSDIELYHADLLKEARRGKPSDELIDIVVEARERYEVRVSETVRDLRPYLDEELYRVIGKMKVMVLLGAGNLGDY